MKRHICLLLLLIGYAGVKISAQNMDDVDSSQTQLFADNGKTYLVADIAHGKHMRWANGGNKAFTYQIGFAPILD